MTQKITGKVSHKKLFDTQKRPRRAPRITLFKAGNRAILFQVFITALQAIATSLALFSISQILGMAFSANYSVSSANSVKNFAISVFPSIVWIFIATLMLIFLGIAQQKSIQNESVRLRQELLMHAFRLGPARFTEKETGGIVSMMTDSIERVTEYRQKYLGQLFGAILTPLLTLGLIAIFIDWLSALVLLICIPFIPLTIGIFQKKFSKDSTASRNLRAKLASQFLEAIQGLPTLVGIGAAKRIGQRLANTGEANRAATMRLLARNQLLLFVMEACFSLFLVTVAITLSYIRLSTEIINIDGAIALVLLTTQLTTPINEIGGFFYIGLGGRAGMRAMKEFMQRETNSPNSQNSPTPQNSQNPQSYQQNSSPEKPSLATPVNDYDNLENLEENGKAISARNISFSYDGKTPVLTEINFTLTPQNTAILSGSSGGGKSTFLAILSADLIPDDGEIKFFGTPLNESTQEIVREKSAVVHQHTWLFTGTLAENLRLANPQASDEELLNALDKVALGKWVKSLPAKLNTDLGERGAQVSGGQAQRISIARAILSNRELLIFDEPTSQVDLESETVIEQVIKELAATKTIVLVTHREILTAQQNAQYVLREGKIFPQSQRVIKENATATPTQNQAHLHSKKELS